MQIFILDENIEKNAQYYCDRHVCKIQTEICQIISTYLSEITTYQLPNIFYKPTHKNHPCVKWIRESSANFNYAVKFGICLYNEYQYRYNKPDNFQRNKKILEYCLNRLVNDGSSLTPFAQAMPDKYKSKDAVKSYRAYYIGEKSHLFKWTKRDKPEWIKENKMEGKIPKTYLVTCGDCGVTMRIKRQRKKDIVKCRKCGFTSEECDFPDKDYYDE